MKTLTIFVVINFAAALAADGVEDRLAKAEAAYRSEDFNDALAQLEPLLELKDGKQAEPRVKELAAHVLHARGEDHFRKARVAESVADFDRQVELQPGRAAEH